MDGWTNRLGTADRTAVRGGRCSSSLLDGDVPIAPPGSVANARPLRTTLEEAKNWRLEAIRANSRHQSKATTTSTANGDAKNTKLLRRCSCGRLAVRLTVGEAGGKAGGEADGG